MERLEGLGADEAFEDSVGEGHHLLNGLGGRVLEDGGEERVQIGDELLLHDSNIYNDIGWLWEFKFGVWAWCRRAREMRTSAIGIHENPTKHPDSVVCLECNLLLKLYNLWNSCSLAKTSSTTKEEQTSAFSLQIPLRNPCPSPTYYRTSTPL